MTTHNTQTLMALCMLGALVLLAGAERDSLSRGGKATRKQRRDAWRKNVEVVNLILDSTPTGSTGPPRHIGNHSLSPWTYSFKHDNNRIPAFIASASCLLKGCLNAGGQEVMDFESKPIFHQIPVLRRVEVDHKTYAYKLEAETISVGCTCVRPKVTQQQ
ncbi:hypothetical protein AAFF_G00069410 [Aldrovandia affinis]|uniref:Uncharacterized protein n=1 Tax=Aldrovandia affinis TaxID=143900 RepID=A0AAD7RZE8_9TELE|nr:hypothetical protein AAFF_G00069410 [Aldrovandia affinis]